MIDTTRAEQGSFNTVATSKRLNIDDFMAGINTDPKADEKFIEPHEFAIDVSVLKVSWGMATKILEEATTCKKNDTPGKRHFSERMQQINYTLMRALVGELEVAPANMEVVGRAIAGMLFTMQRGATFTELCMLEARLELVMDMFQRAKMNAVVDMRLSPKQ
jgi:hypothetical protein